MLTSLRVKNFKRLQNEEIELGKTVGFIGPNNSGKTTALQALALWEIGLRKWLEKRSGKGAPEKRPGVTINRRDLIAVPVPDSNLLWRDLHVRSISRAERKQSTQNIRIEISVTGVTDGAQWECGFEFDYANQESFYCRPLRSEDTSTSSRMKVPTEAESVQVAFLPPMSGMSATEDFLQDGAINVRIGEGRTAEVLRNLCLQVYTEDSGWGPLVGTIKGLFGVTLLPPVFIRERGQITMAYKDGGVELDLVSSGRGLQQTLLLLAHIYTHPRCVLLLDEPDAHLEILRQRQIYQMLTQTAESQGCQVVMASHSEVILNEAADRDILVAFVGKPHRIDDRGTQASKALRSIGYEHYYQAEQTGWVLYLEGSTDLAILRSFASLLNHPSQIALEQPFVHYIGNDVPRSREHFYGLREAKPDLIGVSIFDKTVRDLRQDGPLVEKMWSKREIENYLCFRETLLAYASATDEEMGPLIAIPLQQRQIEAMETSITELEAALKTLGKPSPFADDIKASDEFLAPLFRRYFEILELPNLLAKTDYHTLVKFVPINLIHQDVIEMLDAINMVHKSAKPIN